MAVTLEQQRALALARARVRLQGQGAQPQETGGALQRGTRAALATFLDNALGAPNALLRLAQSPQTMSPLAFGPLGIPAQLARQQVQQRVGAPVQLPTPTATDVFAGAQTLGEAAGALRTGDPTQFTPFGEAREQQGLLQQAQAGTPAGIAGGLLGEGLTLATGRLPIARAVSRAPAAAATIPRLALEPGARRALDRVLRSPGVTRLARGAGRSLETGIEGAVLATLTQGDPLEVGAYSAASQLGGSALLQIGKGLVSGGPASAGLKLGAAAFALGSLVQLSKTVTPGGKNFILESIESGYDKVALSLVLGAGAGLVGAGRVRGRLLAEDFPKFADALTAVPRGAALSALRDYLAERERGSQNVERVSAALIQDPGFFGDATGKLERAFNEGKLGATIEKLIETDPGFRERFDAIGTPAGRVDPQATLRDAVSADNEGARMISSSEAAGALARRIPRASPLHRTFERGGPRTFIFEALGDEDAAQSVLPKLGARERRAVLEVELSQVLTAGLRPVQGGRVIDAQRLRNAWRRLPEVTRAAYPPGVRDNITRFIGEALDARQPLFALPPLLAHSLMMDGALTRRLRGNSKE